VKSSVKDFALGAMEQLKTPVTEEGYEMGGEFKRFKWIVKDPDI
jgi:hypothetical protein